MADRQTDDFKLGNKAADMWLYTADACANEKVIPKKYRYTTGTALMNGAEAICSCIEGANLIDLRERPAERLAMQREALCACKKLERKILRMAESKQLAPTLPGSLPGKAPDTSGGGRYWPLSAMPDLRSTIRKPSKDV